jgi:hypothetical protein
MHIYSEARVVVAEAAAAQSSVEAGNQDRGDEATNDDLKARPVRTSFLSAGRS